jgi:hypothetical protein
MQLYCYSGDDADVVSIVIMPCSSLVFRYVKIASCAIMLFSHACGAIVVLIMLLHRW